MREIKFRGETVGQYTGFHDRYHAEIYEGDIIRCDDGHLRDVEWCHEEGAWKLRVLPNMPTECYIDPLYFGEIGIGEARWAVVGNVFDNTELERME